jgi:hypothetical protein
MLSIPLLAEKDDIQVMPAFWQQDEMSQSAAYSGFGGACWWQQVSCDAHDQLPAFMAANVLLWRMASRPERQHVGLQGVKWFIGCRLQGKFATVI